MNQVLDNKVSPRFRGKGRRGYGGGVGVGREIQGGRLMSRYII